MATEHAATTLDKETESYLLYLRSPAYKARRELIESFEFMPDFGVGHLSLRKAADLLTVDMWGSGDLDADVPESDEENPVARTNDPVLLKALEPQREMILARLLESVDRGSLKPSNLVRSLTTGGVDPDSTTAEYESLVSWMEEFGHRPGDWMSEYINGEGDVHGDLVEALADIRVLRSQSSSENERERELKSKRLRARISIDSDGNSDYSSASNLELREIINGYAELVAHLRHEISSRPQATDDRPLQPKSRNTLYRLIVALCVAAKVDPASRTAASTIEGFTQRVGLPVGDDTIRKILSELPEPGVD